MGWQESQQTVEISGTPSVEISGTPAVEISGTPTVELAAGAEVAIAGTPAVEISGTVDTNISAGSVQVANVTGGVLVSTATAPQQLLASPGPSTTSVTVTLPTNAETIAIVVPSASYAGTLVVRGVASGFVYPVGSISTLSSTDFLLIAPVFAALDSQVEITLSVAPGIAWYVLSDSVERYGFGTAAGGSPLVETIMPLQQASGGATNVSSVVASFDAVLTKSSTLLLASAATQDGFGTPGSISAISDSAGLTWTPIDAQTVGWVRGEYWRSSPVTAPTEEEVTIDFSATSSPSLVVVEVLGLAAAPVVSLEMDGATNPPFSSPGVAVPTEGGALSVAAAFLTSNANALPLPPPPSCLAAVGPTIPTAPGGDSYMASAQLVLRLLRGVNESLTWANPSGSLFTEYVSLIAAGLQAA